MTNPQQQPEQVPALLVSVQLLNAIRQYLGECKEKEVGHLTKGLDFEVSQQTQQAQQPPEVPSIPGETPPVVEPTVQ